MNEIAIHRTPKKGREWRIALSNNYAWLILVGEGCMNENAIHGATKKGREWRIALTNHYAWLHTRRWRMHE